MNAGEDERQGWAQSFGADAERYDRTRPRYPEVLVRRIVDTSPGRDVLDVGCGTGIVARQLQAVGCRVLGIDVDARMVGVARESGVPAEVAAFESWDPAGRSFDAVVSGQTWHWLDVDAAAARAAQALRPAGRLAVFWNVFRPPAELVEPFAAVYRALMPGRLANTFSRPALEAYAPVFAATTDSIHAVGRLDAPERWEYEWSWSYSRDAWLEQVPSFGGHRQLAPEQLERLLAGLGSAVDAVGGSFTMAYTTVAVTAVRTRGGS